MRRSHPCPTCKGPVYGHAVLCRACEAKLQASRAPRKYVAVKAAATTGQRAAESRSVSALRAWTDAVRDCGGARRVRFGRADVLSEDFNTDCGMVGRRML